MDQRSDEIRRGIEHTRGELGETVDALAAKADVPSRAKGWLGDKKDAVTGKVSDATSAVTGAVPNPGDVTRPVGRMRRSAERNPLGLALGGAAVGFLAGLLAPSTRVEDERLGPMADDVKEAAVETGREAMERGKQVVQDAGQTALETAKERASEEGDELTSTLKRKARDVGGTDEDETEVTRVSVGQAPQTPAGLTDVERS